MCRGYFAGRVRKEKVSSVLQSKKNGAPLLGLAKYNLYVHVLLCFKHKINKIFYSILLEFKVYSE